MKGFNKVRLCYNKTQIEYNIIIFIIKKVIQLLISNGASINITDQDDTTPLHWGKSILVLCFLF